MKEKGKETDELKNELEELEAGQLAVDVYQTDKEIIMQSAIAGIKPEDLDISIQDDSVTIKGVRRREEDIEEKDYLYQECFYGKFIRTVVLPQDVDPEQSTANLKNGILTIRMPKVEKQKFHK